MDILTFVSLYALWWSGGRNWTISCSPGPRWLGLHEWFEMGQPQKVRIACVCVKCVYIETCLDSLRMCVLCMHVFMHACVYVCMYICICVMHIQRHMHICMNLGQFYEIYIRSGLVCMSHDNVMNSHTRWQLASTWRMVSICISNYAGIKYTKPMQFVKSLSIGYASVCIRTDLESPVQYIYIYIYICMYILCVCIHML